MTAVHDETAVSVAADLDMVRHWIGRVYGHMPGTLVLNHEPAQGRFVGTGGQCFTHDQAAERVAALDQVGARGIYLRTTTVNRRLDQTERGGAGDSHALPGLWADVDFGDVGHKPGPNSLPLPPDTASAWRLVTESGLPAPTLWIHSGGGLYPWWLLDQPLILDDDTRSMAADLSAKWQQALGRSAERLGWDYGTGIGDLARVLRVPGTVNRKAGLERPCRIVEDTGPTYTLTELLEALAAVTPRPEPQQPAPQRTVLPFGGHHGDSAFDQLDQHVTFDDILTGAGWARHDTRHPAAIDQCWTRPGNPEHDCSAHTLKANPHVLVVHSEAAGLPTGGGQKLTKGRVFAHLHHHGDERAAALDIFAAIGGRDSTSAAAALPLPRQAPMTQDIPAGVDPVTGEVTDDYQPDEPGAIDRNDFWQQRPELQTIHQFARARRAAPWAVFGCVLTRIIAYTEPNVVLPPIIGGDASLNFFLGIVGPSGGGKGAAESAAKDLLAVGAGGRNLVEAGVGSGEGITHTYMRHVPAKNGQKPTTELHTTRALFRASEVDTLAALKQRQGSTLLPRLRDAWMGDNLGFAYADATRRLDLRAHTYRMCLIVGIQPAKASVLLDDADGGTPQRFVWLPTVDPNTPDQRPDEPERLRWSPPPQPIADINGRARMTVCDTATTAIDQAALDRARGNTDALDGHALLARLKIAAGLALLQRRNDITDDDWALAGTVMRVSDTTRTNVANTVATKRSDINTARGRAEGQRAIVAAEVQADAATARVARNLMRKLGRDWTPSAQLRRTLASRDRKHFDDALERLLQAGLIEQEDVDQQNGDGTRYRLTKGRP